MNHHLWATHKNLAPADIAHARFNFDRVVAFPSGHERAAVESAPPGGLLQPLTELQQVAREVRHDD
ncbi:MAG: hypothetical protein NZT92_00380 [Abditibacteriales bacterium]|nr:hypothetical protein [Abditibacteriales bacterium]MDW8364276.1 hypothetical protein [Abditibacteriales bacterium]